MLIDRRGILWAMRRYGVLRDYLSCRLLLFTADPASYLCYSRVKSTRFFRGATFMSNSAANHRSPLGLVSGLAYI